MCVCVCVCEYKYLLPKICAFRPTVIILSKEIDEVKFAVCVTDTLARDMDLCILSPAMCKLSNGAGSLALVTQSLLEKLN